MRGAWDSLGHYLDTSGNSDLGYLRASSCLKSSLFGCQACLPCGGGGGIQRITPPATASQEKYRIYHNPVNFSYRPWPTELSSVRYPFVGPNRASEDGTWTEVHGHREPRVPTELSIPDDRYPQREIIPKGLPLLMRSFPGKERRSYSIVTLFLSRYPEVPLNSTNVAIP